VRLLAKPETVKTARRLVRSCLLGWGQQSQVDVAVLLTSEVVTNAVLHGGPHAPGAQLDLDVDVSPRRVRVEVSDQGAGVPLAGDGSTEALSGRGILMVEAMASAWGIRPNGPGKSVWFEVDAMATTANPDGPGPGA